MTKAEVKGEYDYRGMYTALLTHQGRAVCAAVFRAFGAQLAEVPLVATKADARRQGHCRVLMSAFEVILKEVRQAVVPHCLTSITLQPQSSINILCEVLLYNSLCVLQPYVWCQQWQLNPCLCCIRLEYGPCACQQPMRQCTPGSMALAYSPCSMMTWRQPARICVCSSSQALRSCRSSCYPPCPPRKAPS